MGRRRIRALGFRRQRASIWSRDDWVFYLEFAQLVSVCRAPFATVADVSDRVSAMLTLTCAIPPDARAQYQVARPTAPPGPSLDTPENRQRLRAIMDAMPPDQRRVLMTRLRTEGPNAVFGELLSGTQEQRHPAGHAAPHRAANGPHGRAVG